MLHAVAAPGPREAMVSKGPSGLGVHRGRGLLKKSDRQLLRTSKISMVLVSGKEADKGREGRCAAVRLNGDASGRS